MNKFIVFTIAINIALGAMATNNVPVFSVKHPSAVVYTNPAVYDRSAHSPASYYYDARLNALQHEYASTGHFSLHGAPLGYVLAHTVPSAVSPVHLAAPVPPFAPYVPPHILSHLEARHFIGRHFPKA